MNAVDFRDDPAYLRALLADLRISTFATIDLLGWLVCCVRVLARRAAQRPADIEAERRILGALLLGRATPEDVAELEPGDFEGLGHAELFAVIVSALELAPGARPGPALRRLLFGRVRKVASRIPGWQVALEPLRGLPWPGGCPREEIAVVAAFAAWRRAS